MRRLPLFFLLGLVPLLQGCDSSLSLGLKVNTRFEKLSNGLQVLLIEDPRSEAVTYQTWVRAGSAMDPPGKSGIAHLFEHLLFKGTERFPGVSFYTFLESQGAEVNAYTTRDYTVFYENFAPALLPEIIDREADRLTGMELTDEKFDAERFIVFEERKARLESGPKVLLEEALWSLAWHLHPYRAPIQGIPFELIHLELADLRAFYEKYYVPSNTTVIVAGPIQATKTLELIKDKYATLEKRPIPPPPLTTSEQTGEEPDGERRRILDQEFTRGISGEWFAIGYPITSASEPDSYPIDLLHEIIFNGKGSLAYDRIVTRDRLCVRWESESLTPRFRGLLSLYGKLAPGHHTEEVEAAFSDVFRELDHRVWSNDDLVRAKKRLTLQLVDGVRSPFGLAAFAGLVTTVFGSPDRLKDDLSQYEAVTPKDLERVYRKYLDPNRRNIVILKGSDQP